MNTKDFDWESDKTNELVERLNDFMGCNYSRCTEHGSLLQKKTIHELRIADRDNYRQQLLKAVEEMRCEDATLYNANNDWMDGFDKALDKVFYLLQESDSDKAKDNMESGEGKGFVLNPEPDY